MNHTTQDYSLSHITVDYNDYQFRVNTKYTDTIVTVTDLEGITPFVPISIEYVEFDAITQQIMIEVSSVPESWSDEDDEYVPERCTLTVDVVELLGTETSNYFKIFWVESEY